VAPNCLTTSPNCVSISTGIRRAVELYIKLGKRVRATIRQLGYPTKNALKGWFREYERSLDLPKGYARPKPKYSQGQKETAVRHYLGKRAAIPS
jgi:hypothetical protein